MSSETIANDRRTGGEVDLVAHPDRITAGGIVLLTATLPLSDKKEGDDVYDVAWTVEGPVQLSEQDTRIVLLGATTVVGNRTTLSSKHKQSPTLRATLDTAPLSVGSWTISIQLTPVDDGNGTGNGNGNGEEPAGQRGRGTSGRWVRRRGQIVLLGA